VNKTAALRGWAEAGLHTVTLPTGTIVRVRLPSIEHLLRKKVFPHELEALAMRFTMEKVVYRDLDTEGREQFLAMKDRLIAYSLRQRLVSGSGEDDDPANEWEDVDLTPFLLDLEQVIPAEDLDALGMIAIRYKPPAAVTAESRMQRDMTDRLLRRQPGEPAENRTPEGESAPVAGDFRRVDNDAGGDAARADGGEIRLPAEQRNGARRSGNRAADRPGATPSPGDERARAG
jgi:hypothetical protein